MAHTTAYTLVTRDCPELHQELREAIEWHMSGKKEINSTKAGAAILPSLERYQEWEDMTGSDSSSVFGEILRDVALAAGWQRKSKSGATVYSRPR